MLKRLGSCWFCACLPPQTAQSNICHDTDTAYDSGAAGSLTGLTLDLYSYIIEQLPPTPSRFHYIFNLRDLSRVTEGLLLASPTCCTTAAQFVRLWRNEVLRVFHDRLISPEDKQASCNHATCQLCSCLPAGTAAHCQCLPLTFA